MHNRIEKLILERPMHPVEVKRELCEFAGIHINTLNRYIKLKNVSIDARIAINIAKYFDVSVEKLYEMPAKKKSKFSKRA